MLIGVPSEIKPQESRVGLTPASVKELVNHGNQVLIQDNAGFGAGFDNIEYENAGAKIVNEPKDIFDDADMIVKVKEPLQNEVNMLHENQILSKFRQETQRKNEGNISSNILVKNQAKGIKNYI